MRDRWWVLASTMTALVGWSVYLGAFHDGHRIDKAPAFIGVGLVVLAMLLFAHPLLNWCDRWAPLMNGTWPPPTTEPCEHTFEQHGDPTTNGH